jgi:hypothetical protein
LNDTLLVGPTVHQELYSIVLRFRTYQIAFTADIAKMYRQAKVHERCALDIVGPTDVTKKGNKYILTFQDDLTKFVFAISIPTQDAETVAREFVQNVLLIFGIPEAILTDQGANFLSEIFACVSKLLQIRKI